MRYIILAAAAVLGMLAFNLRLNAQPYGMDASAGQQNLGIYAGKVIRIDRIPHRKDFGNGSHLLLEMRDGRRVDMRLGPQEYLQDIGFSVQPMDEIVVWGYPTRNEKEEFVIVHCIRRGPDKYLFRDAEGVPFWRARRIRFQ